MPILALDFGSEVFPKVKHVATKYAFKKAVLREIFWSSWARWRSTHLSCSTAEESAYSLTAVKMRARRGRKSSITSFCIVFTWKEARVRLCWELWSHIAWHCVVRKFNGGMELWRTSGIWSPQRVAQIVRERIDLELKIHCFVLFAFGIIAVASAQVVSTMPDIRSLLRIVGSLLSAALCV